MRIVDTAVVHMKPHMNRKGETNREFVNFKIGKSVDRAKVRDGHERSIAN